MAPITTTNGPDIAHLRFNFFFINDLWLRSCWSRLKVNLTSNTHININTVNCLYLPIFRSQATKLSGKSKVSTFSHLKRTFVKIFDLAV